MSVDAGRLWDSLAEVNAIGTTPAGGAERLAWSAEELAARRWFAARAEACGLEVEWDAAGNVWGWGEQRPAVVLGSHLDTVPDGGRFDGALGIVAALEAVRSSRHEGAPEAERLAAVCFTDEEGVRFGVGMAGSRAVAGTLPLDEVEAARAADGTALRDVMISAGFDPELIPRARERLADIGAYLELHIEQGPRLERAGAPAGIVTAIVGLTHWHVDVVGEANHAGTTLPEDRRDALVPVAAMVLEAQTRMRSSDGVVATVGAVEVEPGAPNIVPGRAGCSLDVRSQRQEDIDRARAAVLGAGAASAEVNGCSMDAVEIKHLAPARMDDAVIGALERAAAGLDLDAPRLESLAAHDAMNLASAGVPCGMLFVRSAGGVSHSPRERSSREDCAVSARVLEAAALSLAAAGPRR